MTSAMTSRRSASRRDDLIKRSGLILCLALTACDVGIREIADELALDEMAPFEVTIAEYSRFIDAAGYSAPGPCWSWDNDGWAWNDHAGWRDPLFEQSPDHPVTCVSWNDAAAYIAWLNETTDETWRLPSEDEWEVAARAGTTGENYWEGYREDACTYANINDLSGKNYVNKVAEPCDDGHIFTAPVGSYLPNQWGFHDMQGNVWEWTSTCFDNACTEYVARGGAWLETPGPVTVEAREWRAPDERYSFIGFRVVRVVD